MFTPVKKIYAQLQDRKARLNERALLEAMYQNDTTLLKRILKNEAGCVMKMVRGAKQSKALPLYVFMAGGRSNGQISHETEIVLNEALLCHLANISNDVADALRIFEEQILKSVENSNETIEVFLQPWKKHFTESKTHVVLEDVRARSSAIYDRLPMAIETERLNRTAAAAGYAGFLF